MNSEVKTQSFFLEVKDDECIALQSALTARMHLLNKSMSDPILTPDLRQIHRNSFTKLSLLRSRLLVAFTDVGARS